MNGKSLPMMAFSEIPNPKENAFMINALVKESGRVVGYRLSNNNIISKEEAINMAKNGDIKGVGIAKRKDNYYLKSLPDEKENNNLGNLPAISTK